MTQTHLQNRNRIMDMENRLVVAKGNYIQYPVLNHNRKEREKVQIYKNESLCCTAEINTTL